MRKRVVIWFLWLSPLLALAFGWLHSSFSGEPMTLQGVELRARQLAGPNAVFCGHTPLEAPMSVQGDWRTESKWEVALRKRITGCEVAAFRSGKPFYSTMDTGGGYGIFPYALIRYVTVLTAQGKLIELKCVIDRYPHPEDQVRLRQRECSNPHIGEMFPGSQIISLECD